MDKKQKENIKRIVAEGLNTSLNKLKISKPSGKMERALKKYAKKLTDQFQAEIKKLGKKKGKVVKSKRSNSKKVARKKSTRVNR